MYLFQDKKFNRELVKIVIPITCQGLLQSAFSVIDQIMTGQLGSAEISSIGISGRYMSLLTMLVNSIATAAGIIIAQEIGRKNVREVGKGFYSSLILALLCTVSFSAVSFVYTPNIANIYSEDKNIIIAATSYLRICLVGLIPVCGSSLLSTYLRCNDSEKVPLYAGIISALMNTLLNYMLIFGHYGLPRLGIQGAAIATVISQFANFLIMLFAFMNKNSGENRIPFAFYRSTKEYAYYSGILMPVIVSIVSWAFGDNAYGIIYGHIGTDACAAMMIINPLMTLIFGALTGVSQAASIMVGKLQGEGKNEETFIVSRRMLDIGFMAAAFFSIVLVPCRGLYIRIFDTNENVKKIAADILISLAAVLIVKVLNMIISGIFRSGGKTKYMQYVDVVGTWLIGIPVGFVAAFKFNMPIAEVYFLLSMEEVVRFIASVVIFRKGIWTKFPVRKEEVEV